jgi:hypothetical protein
MSAADLIHALAARGVEFSAQGDRLIIDAPKGTLRRDEIDRLREHRREVLAFLKPRAEIDPIVPSPSPITETPDTASEALSVLTRLKGYTLLADRMAAARATVERLRPVPSAPELDPAAALAALKATEAELTALGGTYDSELAAAIRLVSGVFPGARMVELQ